MVLLDQQTVRSRRIRVSVSHRPAKLPPNPFLPFHTAPRESCLTNRKDTDGKGADAYGYAESFLAILFAWGGFNQANYVMGEVDDPRKRYKWPAFSAVAIVSILYILVNVAYFIVVPEDVFANKATNSNVAHQFFLRTLGQTSGPWAEKAPRMLSAFMAISSLGNVIVMTYTAARVKQEIAKEGILPFRKFFASSVKSFRFSWWRSKKEALPEDIPLGALILHLIMSLILIVATWKIAAKETYGLLVDLYSYAIDAIFGAFVGLGLVYMRLFSGRGWAKHSAASGFKIPSFVSTTCAFIYGIANLYDRRGIMVNHDIRCNMVGRLPQGRAQFRKGS
jgi:amino acid transporter